MKSLPSSTCITMMYMVKDSRLHGKVLESWKQMRRIFEQYPEENDIDDISDKEISS